MAATVPLTVPRRRDGNEPAGHYWYPLPLVFEANEREIEALGLDRRDPEVPSWGR